MKKSLVYSFTNHYVFYYRLFFLRFAYNASDKFPFTREVISALLCTIATVSIAHKLALVASYPVIEAYNSFLTDTGGTISDKTITSKDSDFIAEKLALLTLQMREDLIGGMDKKPDTDRIKRLIISNTQKSIENFKAMVEE